MEGQVTAPSLQLTKTEDRCRSQCGKNSKKAKKKRGSNMYYGKSYNRTPYIDKYPHICKKKNKCLDDSKNRSFLSRLFFG